MYSELNNNTIRLSAINGPPLALQYLVNVDVHLRGGIYKHQFKDVFVGEKLIWSDTLDHCHEPLVHG